MPLIKVNVFENELTNEQSANLIHKITDAVTDVTSDKLRDVTWVIVEEVKDGNWGVGGHAIGLSDVQEKIAAG